MGQRTCGVIVAGIGALAAAVLAQAPPVFHAGTDIVQVDASVLDKDRHPLRGRKHQ